MTSLTFVSVFKQFYAMFYRPSTTPIYATPYLFKSTPSGNTVRQHYTVSKPEQGDQTGHGLFCQTLTKFGQIHCQNYK